MAGAELRVRGKAPALPRAELRQDVFVRVELEGLECLGSGCIVYHQAEIRHIYRRDSALPAELPPLLRRPWAAHQRGAS